MKIIYTFVFCLMATLYSYGQGLEGVIVEKYYISNEADKVVDGDGGELPVLSVTYRVFVDMAPGYILQAVFGNEPHPLSIKTSTKFFNNIDRGGTTAGYSRSQAEDNTVMLDSWISMGGAMRDHLGVLKEYDDGMETIVNGDGVLQNDDERAGIPISEQDGIVAGEVEDVTIVGFFDTDLGVLDDNNDAEAPVEIRTVNGAWNGLPGAMGPDSMENILLIGQFTTDGVFEFELNLQLRNETTLEVETWVAKDAQDEEFQSDELVHIDSLGETSSTQTLVEANENIVVYPNPASTGFTIDLDASGLSRGLDTEGRYAMYTVDGSNVASGRLISSQTTVNTRHLSPGVYLLNIELSSGDLFAQRVIITP